jgi:MOSC domain-containing protein YiiM
MGHILSINTGIVQPLFVNSEANAQSVMSAIRKAPLSGRVMVNRLGIAGDERADMSVHGGCTRTSTMRSGWPRVNAYYIDKNRCPLASWGRI